MSIYNHINKIKNNKINQNEKITINNGIIKYNKINNLNKITFIIITTDKNILKKSTNAIIEFQKENKEKEITVFVSSNYEKLRKLSNGLL